MPQYNAYPVITELDPADLVLVWQDASSANKIISFADLVVAVNGLLSREDAVSILAGDTTLDSTYQFVVCNSGGTFTLTLPDSASNPGLKFRIGNKGAGTVTVARAGGDNIAKAGTSSTTITIAQYNTIVIEADGAGYWFAA